jgi:hypothetical protein
MSDLKFSDNPPKNGKSVRLISGQPAPTPYHVQVWVNGVLSRTQVFASKNEAERYLRQESLR